VLSGALRSFDARIALNHPKPEGICFGKAGRGWVAKAAWERLNGKKGDELARPSAREMMKLPLGGHHAANID
jgi:hypothetical protein